MSVSSCATDGKQGRSYSSPFLSVFSQFLQVLQFHSNCCYSSFEDFFLDEADKQTSRQSDLNSKAVQQRCIFPLNLTWLKVGCRHVFGVGFGNMLAGCLSTIMKSAAELGLRIYGIELSQPLKYSRLNLGTEILYAMHFEQPVSRERETLLQA